LLKNFFLVLTGITAQAKYQIFNDKGEQIYYAFEGKNLNIFLRQEKKIII